MCDLLNYGVTVDLESLELGVQRFLNEVEDLGQDVTDAFGGVSLPTCLTVFAVSAAVFEVVRLQLRRSERTSGLVVGPGGEASGGLPESVGRPPEDVK